MTSKTTPYLTSNKVKSDFVRAHRIGSGTDGCVDLYTHRQIPKKSIVVKYPKGDKELLKFSQRNLVRELEAMKVFRPHKQENVVELLGWDDGWAPDAPALFYEYCPLGDLIQYRKSLKAALGPVIPEETLWKFFADISKGLDFLSSVFINPVIHGDIKPANCLVAMPPGCTDKIPTLPIFKLADFSRATAPVPGETISFYGTWAYAPPIYEREMVTPATDIFGLGATLQAFAYGAHPTQLKPDFIQRMRANGWKEKDLPTVKDLTTKEEWRSQIPVVYRPLDAAPAKQVRLWGVLEKNVIAKPYDAELNYWYRRCLDYDVRKRVLVQDLVHYLVPLAARKIKALVEEKEKEKEKEKTRLARRLAAEKEKKLKSMAAGLSTSHKKDQKAKQRTRPREKAKIEPKEANAVPIPRAKAPPRGPPPLANRDSNAPPPPPPPPPRRRHRPVSRALNRGLPPIAD